MIFTENMNFPVKDKAVHVYRYQRMDALLAEFERFIRMKKVQTMLVYRKKNIERLFMAFKGNFRQTTAAGGAVINKKNEVLMIHRHGRWDLPKGKKNRGERKRETAIREVMEETGLQELKIKKKLMVTHHFYRRNKRLIVKKTHWFLMTAGKNQELTPATDEGIVKVKWIPFEKARKKSNKTFRSIAEVLCKAISC
ncbi:MAG: NUDIX domain-containing protein [Bacteroidales bacterium]|nr:NUDIX domain-containing protein [Bacteroidales bacterium]